MQHSFSNVFLMKFNNKNFVRNLIGEKLHKLLIAIGAVFLLLTIIFSSAPVTAEEKVQDLGEIIVEDEADTSPASVGPEISISEEDAQGINASTIDDFIKYEPSLIVRRRYIGDPNGTLGIRGSNMFQTTRSMVFADGLPLHYLLQSRYSGAPRWSLVSPDETESVEVIYGPFSAEYGGNAMGGVVNIKTKLPTEQVFHVDAGIFSQDFEYMGADDTYTGHKEFISYGDRFDNLSVYLFHNRLENDSQPQSFRYSKLTGTPGAEPIVTGGINDTDAVGDSAMYYGNSGKEEVLTNLTKLKFGYEFGNWQSRLTIAYEDRDRETDSQENYLLDSSGNPIWNGDVIFNGELYTINGRNFAISEQNRETILIGAGLEGDIGESGWQLSTDISYFDVLEDETLSSNRNPDDPAFDGSGRVSEFDDTGWKTFDIKARTNHFLHRKNMRFVSGYHFDHYSLNIHSYNSADYAKGVKTSQRSSTGGETKLHAVFGQWGWDFIPQWDLALGARYEHWRSEGGYYYKSGDPFQNHASRTETGFSPKFSLGFRPDKNWQYRYSLAKAYRFPIVEELYKNVSGTTNSFIADEDLKPEQGIHNNLMAERQINSGFIRGNLFYEVIQDVIFNQTIPDPVAGTVTTMLPIDEVTTAGAEFIIQQDSVFGSNVDARFNINYVDSRVTKHNANPDMEGNVFPRMPKWRTNLLLTYHINDPWNASVGARYASDSYGRLDNTDDVDNVFGGQDSYLFIDLKTTYKITKAGKLSFGIDNVTDETAFVYHPWPQRTVYIQGDFTF